MAEAAEGGDNSFTASVIQVNIDDLTDFRSFLGQEVNANLRPGTDAVLNDHTIGVRFGDRNPGHNVREATQTYFQALSTSATNLQEYIGLAENLIDAIGNVTLSYRASDLVAAGSSAQMEGALDAAVKAHNDMVAQALKSETSRETYRASGEAAISPA